MSDDGTYKPRDAWLPQREKRERGEYYMDRNPRPSLPEPEFEPSPEDVQHVAGIIDQAEKRPGWLEWLWQQYLDNKKKKLDKQKGSWLEIQAHNEKMRQKLRERGKLPADPRTEWPPP